MDDFFGELGDWLPHVEDMLRSNEMKYRIYYIEKCGKHCRMTVPACTEEQAIKKLRNSYVEDGIKKIKSVVKVEQ